MAFLRRPSAGCRRDSVGAGDRARRERSYCAGTTEDVSPTERFKGATIGERLVAISAERLNKTTAKRSIRCSGETGAWDMQPNGVANQRESIASHVPRMIGSGALETGRTSRQCSFGQVNVRQCHTAGPGKFHSSRISKCFFNSSMTLCWLP